MHREDNSRFLLYIEPKKEEKLSEISDNKYIAVLEYFLKTAKEGTGNYSSIDNEERFTEGWGYKGWHSTECGEHSSNKDYLLENGMITNSLSPFYLKWYYKAIPKSEIKKLDELTNYFNSVVNENINKTNQK